MQEAFREKHGLQCGYCTPGMIMAAVDLLDEGPEPTDEEIRHGLEGNLCRCTGYENIVRAVRGSGGGDAMTTAAEAPASLSATPVRRIEDPRMITGEAKYLDDLKLPGMAHVAILRSPYAHARIKSIDTTRAAAAPGVVAVYTGKDFEDLPALPCAWQAGGVENLVNTPRALEIDRVTFTGAGVAAVVAESRDAAEDALELIEVD